MSNTSYTLVNSIAIGGFDGMHRAHQALFSKLGKYGAIVVIETGYANLTPKTMRQEHTHYPIVYIDLAMIKHMDDKAFALHLKTVFKNLKKVVVGYDFRFGKDRSFGIQHLKALFDEVEVVDEVLLHGNSVHSHVIRNYLKQGNIKQANAMLNRCYTIKGKATKGQGLGSKAFVPTVNITDVLNVLPKEGVYITRTSINLNTVWHKSISFIGHRKTTDGSFAVETHILNESIDIDIEDVHIAFEDFVRDNAKFESFDALKMQILSDIKVAKTWFDKHVT